MANAKISFKFAGTKFSLASKLVEHTDYRGRATDTPVIRATPPTAGKLVKQFVKAHYPQLVCSVASESFSMGNALNVYVTNADGTPPAEGVIERVEAFVSQFKMGRFDGMTDSYEYSGVDGYTECGMKIDPSVKFASVRERAKGGSVEGAIFEGIEYGESEMNRYMNCYGMSDAKRRKVAAFFAK